MKKLIVEEKNEGLVSLLGEKITIFTSGYFYTGTLVGVNDTCVKISEPEIVYETGSFTDKKYKDSQSLNVRFWYVAVDAIESFGKLK